jgi:CheY-like chemotaxis protein
LTLCPAKFEPKIAAFDETGFAQPVPVCGEAHALASERETAIATGCDEFDAKPIEFESLIATIRRVLANPK